MTNINENEGYSQFFCYLFYNNSKRHATKDINHKLMYEKISKSNLKYTKTCTHLKMVILNKSYLKYTKTCTHLKMVIW